MSLGLRQTVTVFPANEHLPRKDTSTPRRVNATDHMVLGHSTC